MALNEESVNYVEMILSSNIKSNPNFNYSIYINKGFVPTIHRSKDIEDYLRLMEDLPSFAQVIDITTRLGKGNVGQRLTLAVESLQGFDADPSRPIRNNTHTLGQQQVRETEIKERVELSVRNEYLNAEVKRKEEEIERLKKENNKQGNDLRQAEEYSRAVEKIVKDMQEKGAQSKKSVMDYALDLEKVAPGLIGKFLGMGNDQQANKGLSGTPQQEVDPALLKYAEVVRDLFSRFSQQEFQTLLEIIDLLGTNKDIMPQVRYNLQVYQQERNVAQNSPRTEATPQVTVKPKVKPVTNPQPEEPQQKTVAKPVTVEPVVEETTGEPETDESEAEDQEENRYNEENAEEEADDERDSPPDTM